MPKGFQRERSVADAGIERRSGVALWRQIADHVRAIAAGPLPEGRLPTEAALALRFGVNRHTVRSAIAQLTAEGVLRSEQGRGTFAVPSRRLSYPIARRTRFHTGLEGQANALTGSLTSSTVEDATPAVADALALEVGSSVMRLEGLSRADGRPVSRSTNWFDAKRFAGIDEHFAKSGSITDALAACGVADYVRKSTAISARHATQVEIAELELSPGAIVIVTFAINADLAGEPVQYSESRFAADRVELRVDH